MLQRRTGHAMAEDERFAVDVLAALFSRRSLVRLPPVPISEVVHLTTLTNH